MIRDRPDTGRCLCGQTSYRFAARAARDPLLCHCESCRRATSAPIAAFFTVSDDDWQWTGTPPQVYRSSPGVRRSFCGLCGSPMTFQTDLRPGETDFHTQTLDIPEQLAPETQAFRIERATWARLCDDLPGQSGDGA